MHVAHAPDAVPMLRARAARWQALGRPLRFLDQDEARALTGARQCHGALLDPAGGMLNPLGLARGLAGLAAAAGARIYGRTPVTGIRRERASGGSRRQSTRSRPAVWPCAPTHSRRAPPPPWAAPSCRCRSTRSPPSRCLMASLQPYRRGGSRLPTPAPTFSPRVSLLITNSSSGGMSVLPFRAEGRMSRAIASVSPANSTCPPFPGSTLSARHAAMTPDFMPRIVRLADGLSGAIGCNGRGVALTQVVAHALAETMLEPGKPTVVPEVAGNALPLRPIAPIAASLAVLQVRLKDVLTRLG